MGGPVFTQNKKCLFRQRHVSVLCAFAPMDMDEHALAVNVPDLEAQSLIEPETAGVDSGQVGFVPGCPDSSKNGLNLVNTEYGW